MAATWKTDLVLRGVSTWKGAVLDQAEQLKPQIIQSLFSDYESNHNEINLVVPGKQEQLTKVK